MKLDYGKLDWNAKSNWAFAGTAENLRFLSKRWMSRRNNSSTSIEEFAYMPPDRTLAYGVGDVVVFRSATPPSKYDGQYAVVSMYASNPFLRLKFSDGATTDIRENEVQRCISPAKVPAELIALARAEAGTPVDLSKCPLRKAGACLEA